MIKAIVLDVDGVITGTKKGINFPYPHPKVLKYLKKIQDQGVPVVLCTGRANFAMKEIIRRSDLDNLHITDAGAVIVDPLAKKIVEKKVLDPAILDKIFRAGKSENLYWEMYTLDHWYINKSVNRKFYRIHENTLGVPGVDEKNLDKIYAAYPVTKAMILYSRDQEEAVRQLVAPYAEQVEIQWTGWPMLDPARCIMITAKNVYKRSAVQKVAEYYQIPTAEMLGVGDTIMDWNFVELCGYVGAMGNATDDFKEHVRQRPAEKSFVGPGADKNGVIDIIEHFKPAINFSHKTTT